jgi:2-keto-3-deoxy-L-rhamnonate aldolase RhmA
MKGSMALKLMYITNHPIIAKIAQSYGVDRIWIDLETLGKEERQKNLNTVKSHHTIKDIRSISPLLDTSELLVRINPWYEHSVEEIEQVIDAGADRIMLPMWKTAEEVGCFLETVAGRTKVSLLLETREAEDCLDAVLELSGIDEIHIGLNDLHLSYGLTFMFELLSNGTVEKLCRKIRNKCIPYGFGGIARIGEGMLPAEKIIMEHYRLGSTRTILSRSFCNTDEITDMEQIDQLFAQNMKTLHEAEAYAQAASQTEYQNNQMDVITRVNAIVNTIKERKKDG